MCDEKISFPIPVSVLLQRPRRDNKKKKALGATDVVRWARDCPWWDRKPPTEGVVPPGSPGMCRVVMIASQEAVEIIRALRDPTLCVLMHDESRVGGCVRVFVCVCVCVCVSRVCVLYLHLVRVLVLFFSFLPHGADVSQDFWG